MLSISNVSFTMSRLADRGKRPHVGLHAEQQCRIHFKCRPAAHASETPRYSSRLLARVHENAFKYRGAARTRGPVGVGATRYRVS